MKPSKGMLKVGIILIRSNEHLIFNELMDEKKQSFIDRYTEKRTRQWMVWTSTYLRPANRQMQRTIQAVLQVQVLICFKVCYIKNPLSSSCLKLPGPRNASRAPPWKRYGTWAPAII